MVKLLYANGSSKFDNTFQYDAMQEFFFLAIKY